MATDEMAERDSERAQVYRPGEALVDGDVVQLWWIGLRLELPHPLLLEGEGSSETGASPDGHRRAPGGGGGNRVGSPGQTLHRGGLEHCVRGQLDLQALSGQEHGLKGEEGMASQIEEVVFDTYLVQLEHLGPHGGQRRFGRRARPHHCRLQAGPVGWSAGQRVAVDLPVDRQRQAVDGDERGRHELIR